MDAHVDIDLDDDVRRLLEEEALKRGTGLATLLDDLAVYAAKELRRQRIRAENEKITGSVRSSSQSCDFYEFWARPPASLD